MKHAKRIFLIGPMGAGKSTIGRLLSKALNIPFADTDREIEERTGADIPWIFDVEGEEGFRVREENVIEELTRLPEVVMATGGGAILSTQNRRNMGSRGTVVYLETSVDKQYQRTRKDKNRPLLQEENPRQVLANLMQQRDPLYREIADIVVPTHEGNPKLVVRKILGFLEGS